MAGLSFRDRSALARLAIDRGWRFAVTAVSGLPLIRRRRGSPFADQLLFLPQDLRSADPFRQGGGRPFSKADRSRFLEVLERVVRQAKR